MLFFIVIAFDVAIVFDIVFVVVIVIVVCCCYCYRYHQNLRVVTVCYNCH